MDDFEDFPPKSTDDFYMYNSREIEEDEDFSSLTAGEIDGYSDDDPEPIGWAEFSFGMVPIYE